MRKAGASKGGEASTRQNAPRMGDRILMGAGILLAAASAFFPWYVFLNQDKFGIRTSGFENMRDLPPRPPRNVMSVSPLAMTDRTEDEKLPPPADSLTTATVSSLGDSDANGSTFLDQSFPGKGNFRLLHISNGRALIEDGSGMYIVRVGSILPDNSKLATIEQRDGKWVIITSSGEVYDDGVVARP